MECYSVTCVSYDKRMLIGRRMKDEGWKEGGREGGGEEMRKTRAQRRRYNDLTRVPWYSYNGTTLNDPLLLQWF